MKCYACEKGKLHKMVKKQTYTYKGKSVVIDQPGMWCDVCGEGVLSGDDIAASEKAFQAFKGAVDGDLCPADIRHIRKSVLQLTQKEAGKIFGGGANAFSRYECGVTKPMRSVINLLKMFERHPKEVAYFK